MNLSALGVESAGFPNITAIIDLKNDTSYCSVSYYDPGYHDKTYRLSKKELDDIRQLISNFDVKKLREEKSESVMQTDQPTSTTIFYLKDEVVKVSDYALKRPSPLQELYTIVYKLDKNFR